MTLRTAVRDRCSRALMVGAVVAMALGVTSCAAPSGGVTVTQGVYAGEYSITNSPVTYFYDGVAGQDLNLYFVDNRSGEASTPLATLVAPDGTVVPAVAARGSYAKRYLLPATGRYTIRLQYPDLDTGVRSYYLIVSRDEDRGVVGLGPLGSAQPGQRITVRYDGIAGERLNRHGVDRVIGPDGQLVVDNGLRSEQVTLLSTGSYRLEFERSDALLSHDLPAIPAALGATVVPGLVAGQHVDLLYPGTAGEAIGLAASGGSSTAELRTPADAPLGPGIRQVLPSSGTYIVAVTRRYASTVGTTVWLSRDLDLGVLAEGSWPTPTRVPGQSIALTWSGVTGQSFRIRTLDPPGVKPSITVTAPDGTGMSGVPDPAPTSSSDPWTVFTPAQTGAHGVLVSPRASDDHGLITVELDALP